MPTPKPHQIAGADFLAQRKVALLADEPRVGKTGAAVMACDLVMARKILVITTASGRTNWGREITAWSVFPRKVSVLYGMRDRVPADADVLVVGWPQISGGELVAQITARKWDVVIADESHLACNPEAKRTQAFYGKIVPSSPGACVWLLSGTPTPNGPHNMNPMLASLAPERLGPYREYHAYVRQFCTVKPRFVGGRRIDVVTGGKNIDDLKARTDGFWLRRTQQDVGIGEPIFALHLIHPDRIPAEVRALDGDADAILAAAEAGDTRSLDLHLGAIRRVTGLLKANAVADLVAEEFDSGLDRIVLMCWHSDVIDTLRDRLAKYGVVGVDGRTPAVKRQQEVDAFKAGRARVFVGQMQAAGEAIDLSSAAELIFVESSFVPKDMKQAALRITNHTQTRQTRVRVAALEGSIDEALQNILLRKVKTIKHLYGETDNAR